MTSSNPNPIDLIKSISLYCRSKAWNGFHESKKIGKYPMVACIRNIL
jgi:hypothetical protein